MTENKKKFSAFHVARLPEWEIAAREELQGANPWEKLAYHRDDLTILPYYDQKRDNSSTRLLPYIENSSRGPRTWYNCPSILVQDPIKANERALFCLHQGAEGLYFVLEQNPDFNLLLANIDWPWCSLNFLVKNNPASVARNLHQFILKKKYTSMLHGAFFGNINPAIQFPFRFAGIQFRADPSPVKEITDGFEALRYMLKNDFSAPQFAFSVSIGNDFFTELAKLRAIRLLWSRILETEKIKAVPLFIHAHVMPWTDPRFQPHGNMLKSTTAAIASILGGCDVLTVESEDSGNTTMERAAQNVSNILREESYLSKVADPVAGSSFIEELTGQLSTSVWNNLQRNNKA